MPVTRTNSLSRSLATPVTENTAHSREQARVNRALQFEREGVHLGQVAQYNTILGAAYNMATDAGYAAQGSEDYDVDELEATYREQGVPQQTLDRWRSSNNQDGYVARAERHMGRTNYEEALSHQGTGTQIAVMGAAMTADVAVLWHPSSWAYRAATAATRGRTMANYAALGAAEGAVYEAALGYDDERITGSDLLVGAAIGGVLGSIGGRLTALSPTTPAPAPAGTKPKPVTPQSILKENKATWMQEAQELASQRMTKGQRKQLDGSIKNTAHRIEKLKAKVSGLKSVRHRKQARAEIAEIQAGMDAQKELLAAHQTGIFAEAAGDITRMQQGKVPKKHQQAVDDATVASDLQARASTNANELAQEMETSAKMAKNPPPAPTMFDKAISSMDDLIAQATGANNVIKNHMGAARVKRLQMWSKIPGLSDAAKYMNSNNPIEQMLAFRTLDEGSIGSAVAGNATGKMELYMNEFSKDIQLINEAYNDFLREVGSGATDVVKNNQAFRDFDAGLQNLLSDWNTAGGRQPKVDGASPAIYKAAEAYAEATRKVGERIKNSTIDGADRINTNNVYFPVRHDYSMQLKHMEKVGGKDGMIQMYTDAILKKMDEPDAKLAGVLARSIMRRSQERSLDNPVLNTQFEGDIRTLLENASKSGTVDAAYAKELLGQLSGDAGGKKTAINLRGRIDMDYSHEVNGVKISDMFDGGALKRLMAYQKNMAGSLAMADQGITSPNQLSGILDKAHEWNIQSGMDVGEAKQRLQDMKDIFQAGFSSAPVSGAQTPGQRRATQIMRLLTLGGLGFSQLAETAQLVSQQLAYKGVRGFPEVFESLAHVYKIGKTERPQVLRETAAFDNIRIGSEDELMRHIIALDDKKSAVMGELGAMGMVDNVLTRLEQTQGYLNGYHHVRHRQQEMVMKAMISNLDHVMQSGTYAKHAGRLMDMGIDEKLFNKLSKKFDGAKRDGKNITDLGTDTWSTELTDEFFTAMLRNQDQLIQSARNGETDIMLSRGTANLATQLLKFPITAMRKQALRHYGNEDAESMMAITMGQLFGTAMYAARTSVNNWNDEDLDQKLGAWELALGGANLNGPAALFPTAAQIPMGIYGFGPDYLTNRFGGGGGLTGLSPILSVADKAAGNAASIASGDFEARNVQGLMLMGNLPQVNAIMSGVTE